MTAYFNIRFRWIWWLVLIAVAGVGAMFWLSSKREASPTLKDYGAVPDFTLTERGGRAIARSDLSGQPWIAGFIFTRCPGPCPAMSAQMAYLQKLPALAGRVRLVSFTVDPDYDTPAVLAEYADRFEADKNRWWFLTGKKEEIYALAIKGFHLTVGENPEYEQMPSQGPILHSLRFVLVDARGRIRGYYDSTDGSTLSRIQREVGSLLRERSS